VFFAGVKDVLLAAAALAQLAVELASAQLASAPRRSSATYDGLTGDIGDPGGPAAGDLLAKLPPAAGRDERERLSRCAVSAGERLRRRAERKGRGEAAAACRHRQGSTGQGK
jgi:hypothetical protein